MKKNKVVSFKEKTSREEVWVNGGFFVLEPEIFDYIKNDSTVWEKEPMAKLVNDEQLSAFKHTGFYQPMDTLKEKNLLDNLWKKKNAYWKTW